MKQNLGREADAFLWEAEFSADQDRVEMSLRTVACWKHIFLRVGGIPVIWTNREETHGATYYT